MEKSIGFDEKTYKEEKAKKNKKQGDDDRDETINSFIEDMKIRGSKVQKYEKLGYTNEEIAKLMDKPKRPNEYKFFLSRYTKNFYNSFLDIKDDPALFLDTFLDFSFIFNSIQTNMSSILTGGILLSLPALILSNTTGNFMYGTSNIINLPQILSGFKYDIVPIKAITTYLQIQFGINDSMINNKFEMFKIQMINDIHSDCELFFKEIQTLYYESSIGMSVNRYLQKLDGTIFGFITNTTTKIVKLFLNYFIVKKKQTILSIMPKLDLKIFEVLEDKTSGPILMGFLENQVSNFFKLLTIKSPDDFSMVSFFTEQFSLINEVVHKRFVQSAVLVGGEGGVELSIWKKIQPNFLEGQNFRFLKKNENGEFIPADETDDNCYIIIGDDKDIRGGNSNKYEIFSLEDAAKNYGMARNWLKEQINPSSFDIDLQDDVTKDETEIAAENVEKDKKIAQGTNVGTVTEDLIRSKLGVPPVEPSQPWRFGAVARSLKKGIKKVIKKGIEKGAEIITGKRPREELLENLDVNYLIDNMIGFGIGPDGIIDGETIISDVNYFIDNNISFNQIKNMLEKNKEQKLTIDELKTSIGLENLIRDSEAVNPNKEFTMNDMYYHYYYQIFINEKKNGVMEDLSSSNEQQFINFLRAKEDIINDSKKTAGEKIELGILGMVKNSLNSRIKKGQQYVNIDEITLQFLNDYSFNIQETISDDRRNKYFLPDLEKNPLLNRLVGFILNNLSNTNTTPNFMEPPKAESKDEGAESKGESKGAESKGEGAESKGEAKGAESKGEGAEEAKGSEAKGEGPQSKGAEAKGHEGPEGPEGAESKGEAKGPKWVPIQIFGKDIFINSKNSYQAFLNIGFTHAFGYRDVDVSVSNYFNYVDFIKYLDSENTDVVENFLSMAQKLCSQKIAENDCKQLEEYNKGNLGALIGAYNEIMGEINDGFFKRDNFKEKLMSFKDYGLDYDMFYKIFTQFMGGDLEKLLKTMSTNVYFYTFVKKQFDIQYICENGNNPPIFLNTLLVNVIDSTQIKSDADIKEGKCRKIENADLLKYFDDLKKIIFRPENISKIGQLLSPTFEIGDDNLDKVLADVETDVGSEASWVEYVSTIISGESETKDKQKESFKSFLKLLNDNSIEKGIDVDTKSGICSTSTDPNIISFCKKVLSISADPEDPSVKTITMLDIIRGVIKIQNQNYNPFMKVKIVSDIVGDEYTIEYNDGANVVQKKVKKTDIITKTNYDNGAEVDIKRTILFPQENKLEILFSLGVLLDNQKGQFLHSDVKKNYYGFFSRDDDKLADSIIEQKKLEDKLNDLLEEIKNLCRENPENNGPKIQELITKLNGLVNSELLSEDYNNPYIIYTGKGLGFYVSNIKSQPGDSVFDELLAFKNFVGTKDPSRVDEENYNKPIEGSFLQLQNGVALWAADSKSILQKCAPEDIKLLSDYMAKNTELSKLKTSLLRTVSLKETKGMFLYYVKRFEGFKKIFGNFIDEWKNDLEKIWIKYLPPIQTPPPTPTPPVVPTIPSVPTSGPTDGLAAAAAGADDDSKNKIINGISNKDGFWDDYLKKINGFMDNGDHFVIEGSQITLKDNLGVNTYIKSVIPGIPNDKLCLIYKNYLKTTSSNDIECSRIIQIIQVEWIGLSELDRKQMANKFAIGWERNKINEINQDIIKNDLELIPANLKPYFKEYFDGVIDSTDEINPLDNPIDITQISDFEQIKILLPQLIEVHTKHKESIQALNDKITASSDKDELKLSQDMITSFGEKFDNSIASTMRQLLNQVKNCYTTGILELRPKYSETSTIEERKKLNEESKSKIEELLNNIKTNLETFKTNEPFGLSTEITALITELESAKIGEKENYEADNKYIGVLENLEKLKTDLETELKPIIDEEEKMNRPNGKQNEEAHGIFTAKINALEARLLNIENSNTKPYKTELAYLVDDIQKQIDKANSDEKTRYETEKYYINIFKQLDIINTFDSNIKSKYPNYPVLPDYPQGTSIEDLEKRIQLNKAVNEDIESLLKDPTGSLEAVISKFESKKIDIYDAEINKLITGIQVKIVKINSDETDRFSTEDQILKKLKEIEGIRIKIDSDISKILDGYTITTFEDNDKANKEITDYLDKIVTDLTKFSSQDNKEIQGVLDSIGTKITNAKSVEKDRFEKNSLNIIENELDTKLKSIIDESGINSITDKDAKLDINRDLNQKIYKYLEDIQIKLNKISSTYSTKQDILDIQTKINKAKLDENKRFEEIEPAFIKSIEERPPEGFVIIHTDGIWYYQEKEGEKRKYEVLTSIIPGITNDEVTEIFKFVYPSESTTSNDEILKSIQDKWLKEYGVEKKIMMDKMYIDYFNMIINKLQSEIDSRIPNMYDQMKTTDERLAENIQANGNINAYLQSIKTKIQRISQPDNLEYENDLLQKIDDAIKGETERFEKGRQYINQVLIYQNTLKEFDEEGKLKENLKPKYSDGTFMENLQKRLELNENSHDKIIEKIQSLFDATDILETIKYTTEIDTLVNDIFDKIEKERDTEYSRFEADKQHIERLIELENINIDLQSVHKLQPTIYDGTKLIEDFEKLQTEAIANLDKVLEGYKKTLGSPPYDNKEVQKLADEIKAKIGKAELDKENIIKANGKKLSDAKQLRDELKNYYDKFDTNLELIINQGSALFYPIARNNEKHQNIGNFFNEFNTLFPKDKPGNDSVDVINFRKLIDKKMQNAITAEKTRFESTRKEIYEKIATDVIASAAKKAERKRIEDEDAERYKDVELINLKEDIKVKK